MGRNFRKRRSGSGADQWRGQYRETVKENELLEKYYNLIIPREEQEVFWECLKSPLPATFRLVATLGNPFSDLDKDPDLSSLLEPISFVPNAWKLPANRRTIRKEGEYARVHNWLLQGSEAGAICRQEAVSMLPPLFMQIDRPDLCILDMCAAPGSKTGQLLEYLSSTTQSEVTGVVIANDADKDRAFMLHHQVRRLHSPALLVTCNDASMYPKITIDSRPLRFDRVLCDVPCSGDGTLRKTPAIWSSWSPNQAFGLHSLQVRILRRGLSLLKPGGRLVYSTCSLNPIEDEAVVAACLTRMHGFRLVRVGLPEGLRVSPGRSAWPVMVADGTVYYSYPENGRDLRLHETFFPPGYIDRINIEYSFRILPHHQDTGGFFIAVIERGNGEGVDKKDEEVKTTAEGVDVAAAAAEKPDDTETTITPRDSKFQFDKFYSPNLDMAPITSKYFESPPSGSFLTRSADHFGPTPRSFVYCTGAVFRIVASSPASLKIVNAGVRALERYEPSARHSADVYSCQYRILSELIHTQGMMIRTVAVDRELFQRLIGTDTTVRMEGTDGIKPGGSVVASGRARMSVWKTQDGSIRPFISRQDRPFLLKTLG